MDTNMILRDGTAALTADEALTAVKVGPMLRPMTLFVSVEKTSSGDTLDVELEFSDDGSTQIENLNMKQITTLGLYSVPFYTRHKYLQVKLNETNNGGLDFGVLKVWIAPAGRDVAGGLS